MASADALHGLLNVLKPPGMTSHDVVDFFRRVSGVRRVGHTGTLDPGAAGVLVLCVGRATRAASYLQESTKRYRAEMVLGVSTDTHDASGRTVQVRSDFELEWDEVERVLQGFVGTIVQRPPMASAVRVGGRHLYQLAREGVEVEPPARSVAIHEIRIVERLPREEPRARFGARLRFDVACGAGTYVRTLCADAGERLGCGAHLGFLVRTASGPFRLEDSVLLEELEQAARQNRLAEYLLPVDAGLAHLPSVTLPRGDAGRVRHGASVPWPTGVARPGALAAGSLVRVYDPEGQLVAVARLAERPEGWLVPDRVFVP
ncbi:MAG TPA: tRNA pseudouridine(55) synthase TruB [Limnochordales bacterium]